MTWTGFRNSLRKHGSAAVFAALSLCADPARGEEILLRTADGGVELSGQFLAFDGELLTLRTASGVTSLRYGDMVCEGAACPGPDYVPTLRLAWSAEGTETLLPALAEAYALDTGFALAEVDGKLTLSGANGPVLSLRFDRLPVAEALDALVAGSVDGLVAARELRAEEATRARDAGLGQLQSLRQGRIMALDALVPAVAAGSSLRTISLRSLSDVLSGKITEWQALAGQEGAVTLHLVGPDDALTEALVDRLLGGFGLSLREDVTWHETPGKLASALAEDPGGIGLLPAAQTGLTQPLTLTGRCGFQNSARFLSMKTEDYPLTFPLFLYMPDWRPHPAVSDFLDWMRESQAQLVVRRAGLVDLAGVPIPISAQGDRLANAIRAAGDEVPLVELQRMMRVLGPRVRMSSTFRFRPGSTQLDGPSRANVLLLARAIRSGAYGGRDLLLVGFSDSRGAALPNRDLSSARAESVRREVMRALGEDLPFNVSLDTEAFGEALPIACDDTLWGQQTNRRVELWVRDLDGD